MFIDPNHADLGGLASHLMVFILWISALESSSFCGILDLHAISMFQLLLILVYVFVARCWRSGTFPLCDGSHVKHNKATGDNVGPLLVKK